MGDVVHANFGAEREWEETREKLRTGLLTVGSLFGDDEELMLAKAEAVMVMVRAIVEEVPTIKVNAAIPTSLSSEDVALVTEAVKKATLQGIETMMSHCLQVLMASIYDMCTSKLKRG
jgi:hypothetical protein